MRARPHVLLKVASTLDGAVATRTGESQWITGPEARRRGRQLRGEVDAILVGIGTVLADDPRLTARIKGRQDPVRVVLDSQVRTPPDAQLAVDGAAPTLVLVGRGGRVERVRALEARGVEVITVPTAANGHVDLLSALDILYRRGLGSLLVEGGPTVAGAFLDARCVDRVAWFLAPKVVGGEGALRAVRGTGVATLGEALVLEDVEREILGPDLLLLGRVRP